MEDDTKDKDTKDKNAIKLPPLFAIVELVKRGHRNMLPRLRELLREQPAVWQYVGDLGQQAQKAWVELIGHRDDLLKESTILFAEEMKKSLVGEGQPPGKARCRTDCRVLAGDRVPSTLACPASRGRRNEGRRAVQEAV